MRYTMQQLVNLTVYALTGIILDLQEELNKKEESDKAMKAIKDYWVDKTHEYENDLNKMAKKERMASESFQRTAGQLLAALEENRKKDVIIKGLCADLEGMYKQKKRSEYQLNCLYCGKPTCDDCLYCKECENMARH